MWEGKINGQQIWRNSLSYQFNKNMHIRLIMEYNVVDFYDFYLQQLMRQKYFTVDPMFSFKLSAFSVFYLGGKFGGQNNYYLNWEEVRFTNQSVFVKLQYQFRSWVIRTGLKYSYIEFFLKIGKDQKKLSG